MKDKDITFKTEELKEGVILTYNVPVSDEIIDNLTEEELEKYIKGIIYEALLKGIRSIDFNE